MSLMYVGDLKPDLRIRFSAEGEPFNLGLANSYRLIGRDNSGIVFDSPNPPHVIDGDTSIITRPWDAPDTASERTIMLELEVTWPGGKKQTVRVDDVVQVQVDFDAMVA